MLLRFFVVVNPYEKDFTSILCNLRRVVLPSDLVERSIGGVPELQLDDESRLADIAARYHDKVGIPLARSILAVNDVLILSPDICYRQYAGQRVLVVVGQDAGVLVVRQVDGTLYGL